MPYHKKVDREIKEFEQKKAFAKALLPYENAKTFKFKAYSKEGREIKGLVRAKTKQAAIKGLHENGYTIKKIKEASFETTQTIPLVLNPLAVQEAVTMFTRQLMVLYRAGVPLERAISILFVQTDERHLKQALSAMYMDMIKGKSFKGALSKHPHVFSSDYVAMVEAGEKSGQLALVLEHMADLLEKNLITFKKLTSVMTYPAIVFIFASIVNYAVFKWVLPNFVSIFKDMNMSLPLITKFIILVVDFLQTPWFWLIFIAIILIGGIFINQLINQRAIRRAFDEVALSFPLSGRLIKRVVFIRSFRVFATMLSAGVPMIKTISSVAKVAKNEVYFNVFEKMSRRLEKGRSLTECFEREKDLFPIIVRQMISVGDETGEPEFVLNLLADFYEAELDLALESFSSIVEPLMIGMMGVVVGIVVLAIFVPIYKMITTLS